MYVTDTCVMQCRSHTRVLMIIHAERGHYVSSESCERHALVWVFPAGE